MKLQKPYTDKNYADFVSRANENGQRVEFLDECIFALYPYEILQNGEIFDIASTPEYQQKVLREQNEIKKNELQSQIDSLDIKSVRAIREGGIKDETTGQSWVEYYTQQIQALRAQIASL